jgi:type III secretion system HrpE/YscL family protein
VLLLNESDCVVRTAGRIVKADAVAWVRDASAILQAAQAAAKRRLDEADAAVAQAVEAGFATGLERAAASVAETVVAWQQEQAQFRFFLQEALVRTVLAAVRHYLNLQPEEAVIAAQVRQAWAAVGKEQDALTLRVAPALVEPCRERVRGWLAAYPALERIEVIADENLPPQGCAVGSAVGWVTCSAEVQLEALASALEAAFGEGRDGVG